MDFAISASVAGDNRLASSSARLLKKC